MQYIIPFVALIIGFLIGIFITRAMHSTSIFKIFATADNKIFRQAVPAGLPTAPPQLQIPEVVEINQKCPKCNTVHKIYAKLAPNPKIDADLKNKGFTPFPKNAKINCKCGFEIDLLGIKNQIEAQTGRKVVA